MWSEVEINLKHDVSMALTSQIWGQHGRCNGIRVQSYYLETSYQWLKHFIYVYYGCMKQSEVDISLEHDVMASFPLLQWTLLPKSGGNLDGVTIEGCNHMPLRLHTNGINTLYMSNMDVCSGLRWISASNMTLWHHFHSSSEPESPNLRATWPV